MLPRFLVTIVDDTGADLLGEAFLQFPVGMNDLAKSVEIVPLQFGFHFECQFDHSAEHLLFALLRRHARLLVFQNAGGAARDAGVKDQNILLQPLQRLTLAENRFY